MNENLTLHNKWLKLNSYTWVLSGLQHNNFKDDKQKNHKNVSRIFWNISSLLFKQIHMAIEFHMKWTHWQAYKVDAISRPFELCDGICQSKVIAIVNTDNLCYRSRKLAGLR